MATGGVNIGATGVQDVDGLLRGVRWNDTNVLFNFPSSAAYYPPDYGTVTAPDSTQVSFPAGFVPVSVSFQDMVRKGLQQFELVSNLTFTEVASDAASNISVGRTTSLGPEMALGFRGYGFAPGSSARAGDIWFDDSTAEVGNTFVLGRGTWALVMHELGHAMGLKHGHEGGGPANVAMTSPHDQNDYSIMSYRRFEGGPLSGTVSEAFGRPQSLMMYDMLALQTMYGANFTTNSSDSIYTFSPSTGQMFVNGVGGDIPGNGAAGANRIYRTIWDGGGNDTYDLSNYSTNMTIDLTPGGKSTFSAAQLAIVDTGTSRAATGNVFNALQFQGDNRTLIENANGGPGNDTIIGNHANNWLVGNGGNDTLDGGLGADTMIGGPGHDIHTVDHAGDVVTENSGEGTDTVRTSLTVHVLGANIENLTYTGSNFIIGFGNEANNVMNAASATDSVLFQGLGGADQMTGGSGNDVLYFDSLDTLVQGGGGIDTAVVYFTETAGVSLDLAASSVEEAYGGAGNDVLDASGAPTTVRLIGLGGADQLIGGSNGNIFFFDSLDTVVQGGAGLDFAVVYFHEMAGVSLDLAAANVEFAYGGVGNDILDASGTAATVLLFGDDGADQLIGGSGSDIIHFDSLDTIVQGGSGVDFAVVDFTETSGVSLDLAAANVEFAYGGVGNDVLDASGATTTVQLFGLTGADQLTGGSGDDVLWFDSLDTVVQGGAGVDSAVAYLTGTTAVSLDLTATGIEVAYGEEGNDVLTAAGKAENTRIVGLGGADTLTGGLADDVIFGGEGNDQIFASAGNDYLQGDAGTDTVNYSGNSGDFTITDLGGDFYFVNGPGIGTHTLFQIEVLHFDNGDVIL